MIIFENTLTGVLPAFNNNIIKFKSDSLIESVQAKITINSIEFIIYKIPSGWFLFNFKEIAKSLVNQNNFKDNLITNLDLLDINSFTYEQNDGIYSGGVNIKITFIDGSTEVSNFSLTFLASVKNLEDYKKTNLANQSTFLLLPNIKGTTNQYFVKYFEGYPFDFTYLDTTGDNLQLKTDYSLIKDFERKGNLTRVLFSDGEIDLNNTSLMPMGSGISKIDILQNNVSIDQFLYVDRVQMCGNDAIYLKWFNAQGGYSYYLFNKYFERNLNFGSIGELENDFNNLENTTSPIIQLGRTSFDKVRVDSDLINENEFNLLVGILSSPKVYMFTGLPLARASFNDWIEVEIKTSSINLRNWKNRPTNISFEFELPKRNNQYL